MQIEKLEKALQHKNISIEPREPTAGFNRKHNFSVDVGDGKEHYQIEWWVNVSYLHVVGLVVVFDDVKQSTTWPNKAKLNLQFYLNGKTVAILPIEYYESTP